MNPDRFVANHVKSLPRSGIRDFFAIVQEMPQAISLGIGEPDFVTPWKIREASIFALEKGKTSYTDNRGLLSLKRKFPSMSLPLRPQYDPRSEILVTVGVSETTMLPCGQSLTPVIRFFITNRVMFLMHQASPWPMGRQSRWEPHPSSPLTWTHKPLRMHGSRVARF